MPQDGNWWEGGQQRDSTAEFMTRRLDTPLDRLTRNRAGRRSRTKTERKRGRYIQSRLPRKDRVTDLAFDATLRAAAPYQRRRKDESPSDLALQLRKSDIRERKYVFATQRTWFYLSWTPAGVWQYRSGWRPLKVQYYPC